MAKNENSNFSYMTRMIRNETVITGGTCGIIDSPQMSRQSERSAS